FFFQAEDGIRDFHVTGVQTCALPILREAKRRYPNLRIVYLSSRTYAGYAVRDLNPEPFAYESAFAVRGLIQEQIEGNPRYNADRSEERRVGKECRSRWSPYGYNNNDG